MEDASGSTEPTATAPEGPHRDTLRYLLSGREVSPDLLVRVLVELVANYWSWAGGGGVQPHNPRTS